MSNLMFKIENYVYKILPWEWAMQFELLSRFIVRVSEIIGDEWIEYRVKRAHHPKRYLAKTGDKSYAYVCSCGKVCGSREDDFDYHFNKRREELLDKRYK